MLFNSLAFLLFLPMVFVLYWMARTSRIRNIILLIASYVFYGKWDYRFLILIAVSSLADYLIGHKIYAANSNKKKFFFLLCSLVLNLGILGVFKYFNFFTESFVDLLRTLNCSMEFKTLEIILPVGISFYTFQTLSYSIDIYRGTLKPTKDILRFFTFVAFFPQLVAGPIERASNLLPQFSNLQRFDYALARSGLQLMLWGFFKKVVIADRLAEYVNIVYSSPYEYSGLPLIIATIFFAVQIYCDFSGYSDIAIGVARLFGIRLMTNFRTPYFATSLREFWQRWHISLSTWFRDYLYIPLGGSKTSTLKIYRNIIITFLVSGLWHGANWTFVIWGAIHGSILAIERFCKRNSIISYNIPSFFALASTFSIVSIAWIFFRAENFEQSIYILSSLTTNLSDQFESLSSVEFTLRSFVPYRKEFMFLVYSLILFLLVEAVMFKKNVESIFQLVSITPVRWLAYYFVLAWIFYFGAFNKNAQFIYFQF